MAKTVLSKWTSASRTRSRWPCERLRRSLGATVFCPAVISGGRLIEDTISKDMPLVEGFRSAVKLANELKAPIVVLDPDAVWMPDWGTLYRAAD